MSEEYVEAILLWSDRGPSESVSAWFRERSLAVTPMRAGMLLAGPLEVFEKAFHLALADAARPVSLPVPDELKAHVVSITIPRPRRLH